MKYIGYYDSDPNRRSVSPAAVDKMNYIAKVISRICGDTEILSCATYSPIPDKGHVEQISDSICVRYIRTRGKHKSKIGKIYDILYDRLSIFAFLMKNIKHGETVFVYHSLLNMYAIRLITMIKKVSLVIEVEEIYNDVGGLRRDTRKNELKFIESGSSYIFPTEIMNQQFNKKGKAHVIIHGTYDVNNTKASKFNDKKIHVVYAGTFERNKGGALTAIDSAKYLTEEYTLHILGFGTDSEIKNVTERIEALKSICECRIIYEGKLTGKEYINFISKCHIGLSTQNPEGVYNNTSFPSKILSYMCNGLKVVSVRIPVVETSDVKDGIWYYDSNDPEQLAAAIKNAQKGNIDSKDLIRVLDAKFEERLKSIIG